MKAVPAVLSVGLVLVACSKGTGAHQGVPSPHTSPSASAITSNALLQACSDLGSLSSALQNDIDQSGSDVGQLVESVQRDTSSAADLLIRDTSNVHDVSQQSAVQKVVEKLQAVSQWTPSSAETLTQTINDLSVSMRDFFATACPNGSP